jgi:hypothetical protein
MLTSQAARCSLTVPFPLNSMGKRKRERPRSSLGVLAAIDCAASNVSARAEQERAGHAGLSHVRPFERIRPGPCRPTTGTTRNSQHRVILGLSSCAPWSENTPKWKRSADRLASSVY